MCLYNQALADVRLTATGMKCLYCNILINVDVEKQMKICVCVLIGKKERAYFTNPNVKPDI